jgi:hypothetical protein
MQSVLTTPHDITEQKLVDGPSAPLANGQVRLQIERFAITANNVTYAATGFDIGYWKFFPAAEAGQGLVPVWGFARVVESRSDVVAVGDRFYGFYPMASELVIKPQAHGGRAVRDITAHRAGLPDVYNLYMRAGEASAAEPYQALMQPLIATSFLLFDWLMDNEWFGAKQIVIGSASSKTGLGLCAFLARHKDRPYRVIGLTGDGNAAFVHELGFCDQVLAYDAVDQLDQVASIYVDMAGNGAVKRALHTRLDGFLKHSSAVGLSHWDQFTPPKDLAGPKPKFFFAPAQIAKRKEDWGKGIIEGKIAEATAAMVADAERWLSLEVHSGLKTGMSAYADLAHGRADPRVGHIVEV